MNELVMIEAALFQIRAAAGDEPAHLPVRIAADVLERAVGAAKADGLNPARMSDIDFALADLGAAIDESGAESMQPALAMLRQDAENLRASNRMPESLVAAVRGLETKLRERARAMERGQYRAEDAPEAELPHSSELLREEAIPLARQLAGAGFDTPALAQLIADPESLRYHNLNEIADELEVISGG